MGRSSRAQLGPGSLGFWFSPFNASDFPKIPQKGEREEKAESLSRGSAMYGLEIISTGVRKKL